MLEHGSQHWCWELVVTLTENCTLSTAISSMKGTCRRTEGTISKDASRRFSLISQASADGLREVQGGGGDHVTGAHDQDCSIPSAINYSRHLSMAWRDPVLLASLERNRPIGGPKSRRLSVNWHPPLGPATPSWLSFLSVREDRRRTVNFRRWRRKPGCKFYRDLIPRRRARRRALCANTRIPAGVVDSPGRGAEGKGKGEG